MDNIVNYIFSFLAVLIIIPAHEFAHGYAAYKLGDNTAKNLGRLTLNPLKHFDLVGTLCLVLFHFGWAKPVPINARNFKNPKRDFALTAIAGPLLNLLLAFISVFFILLSYALVKDISFKSEFTLSAISNLILFIRIFTSINIGLAIFNLIPIPPLDGSRILHVILPAKTYFGIMKHENKIYWIFIGWLFLGRYISNFFLSFPFISANPILSAIAGFLNLSNLLNVLISYVYTAMLNFWQLIPFLKI